MTSAQRTVGAALLLALGTATGAAAQDMSGFAAESGISTLGFYVAPSYQLNDRVAARAPIYLGSYSDDFEDDGNTIDGDLEFGSAGLVADVSPWDNGVFLSGGLLFGGYDLSGTTDQFETDATTYLGDFIIDVEQENDVSPVLSVGYRYASEGGMTAGIEFGAKFNSMTADIGGPGYDSLTPAQQADVQAEMDKINDDLDELSVIPFLTVSLGYRF